jgi:hypothetical protein
MIMARAWVQVRIRLGHNRLDFSNSDHWKESTEEQVEREKESKSSDHRSNINPGWLKESP